MTVQLIYLPNLLPPPYIKLDLAPFFFKLAEFETFPGALVSGRG